MLCSVGMGIAAVLVCVLGCMVSMRFVRFGQMPTPAPASSAHCTFIMSKPTQATTRCLIAVPVVKSRQREAVCCCALASRLGLRMVAYKEWRGRCSNPLMSRTEDLPDCSHYFSSALAFGRSHCTQVIGVSIYPDQTLIPSNQ